MKTGILSLVMLLLIGCASTDKIILDASPRTPTTSVDLYVDGKQPSRPFKEIAQFTFLGPPEDEQRATRFCIKQAQKVGAHGLIFEVPPGYGKGGAAFGSNFGLAGWGVAHVYKGRAIVYE